MQETTIPLINDADALLRYLRHTHGDVSVDRFIREVDKLVHRFRKLAEAGDREAVRELVERINNAPAL